MNILKRLSTYVFPYWRTILMIFVVTGFVNLFTLIQPLLFRDLLNKVLLQKNLFYLQLIIGGILLLFALKGVFSYAQGYLMNFVGLSTVKAIREEMFVKLLHLPIAYFETRATGDIFSRVTNDVTILTEVMTTSVVYLANDILVLLGSLVWMIWRSPSMTLVTMIVSPLIALSVLRFGRWMNHVTLLMQSKIGELSSVLFEGIGGIQLVKSFGREAHEIQKFRNKNEDYFTWNMKSVQVAVTQTPVVEFLAVVGIAVMVYYGGYEVIKGKLSIGDMFAFWGYMVLATNPLYRISSTMTNLQKASAAAKRIFEVIDSESEVMEPPNPISLSAPLGKLEFCDVWFRYGAKEPWVLEGVNLKIEPGAVVALVGPSGAGKTSLVGLIPRFYLPTRGKICFDGVDISSIRLSELRSYISIVSQEIQLFSGSIRDNIAYGAPHASIEEVIESAKAANAHDFIMSLPHQYESLIAERGVSLSGGQRQRLAIARALLRNPKILILDEATSNLDSESETLIQEALERLLIGRTTFVIAHRLSTIRNAHKIVAIEDGRIVEVGSHHELIESRGLYSRLYHSQLQVKEA